MAVFIGGGGGSPSKRCAAFLADRSKVYAELTAQRRVILNQADHAELAALLDAAVAEANTFLDFAQDWSDKAEGHFETYAEQRVKRGSFLRYGQFLYGQNRPARDPSKLDAALHVVPVTALEIAGTTALMVGGGAMTVGSALAYAASFGITSTIWGMIAGYQCLRFVGFKAQSPMPEPRDRWIRSAAAVGFGAMVVVLGGLIFAAARTRATGDTASIWNFEAVSVGATFADANSLLLVLIGICSAIIAIRSGFRDLSDPCPGLSDAKRYADDGLNDEVASFTDEAAALIEERGEDALDALDEAIAALDELTEEHAAGIDDFNAKAAAHNAKLDGGFAEFEAEGLARAAAQARIDASDPKPPFKPDRAMFDALRVELIDPGQFTPNVDEAAKLAEARALIGKVRAAMQDTVARLDAAHAVFRASPLDLSPDLT